MVIQAYAPNSNTEEAEVEWFYEEQPQDLSELTRKKYVLLFFFFFYSFVGDLFFFFFSFTILYWFFPITT